MTHGPDTMHSFQSRSETGVPRIQTTAYDYKMFISLFLRYVLVFTLFRVFRLLKSRYSFLTFIKESVLSVFIKSLFAVHLSPNLSIRVPLFVLFIKSRPLCVHVLGHFSFLLTLVVDILLVPLTGPLSVPCVLVCRTCFLI